MRTPGASREPSFNGSPAGSPEWENMACVHESISPPPERRCDDWGVRETTLSPLRSAPDNTEADCEETNPRARFGADISLNEEPSNQALHRLSTQRSGAALQQQQIRSQVLPSVATTAAAQDFAGQTSLAHLSCAPQLPLVRTGHTPNMHTDGAAQFPSLGRGSVHAPGVVQRPPASHYQLPPADQRRMAPSGAVQSCHFQPSTTPQWHDNKGPSVQQPQQMSSAAGLLPPVSHAAPQQPTNPDNFGGPPLFHPSAQPDQYAGQRAYSDAGYHRCATSLHEPGRCIPAQRQLSVAASMQHTQQHPQHRSYTAVVCSSSSCTLSLA